MTPTLAVEDLARLSLQMALVVGAAAALARALRLRAPRFTLAYWQAILAACLLLPLIEPWQPLPAPAPQGPGTLVLRAAAMPSTPIHSPPAAPRAVLTPERIAAIAALVVALLGLGVAGRLGWLLLGLARLGRYRRQARALAPRPAAGFDFDLQLERLESQVGLDRSRAPAYLVSAEMTGPVTYGWRSPVVLLPASFVEMDASLRRAILCHELVHVRRRDWLANLAEELVRALYWFHPLMLWVIGRIRLSREQAVDLEVVELTGARQPYLDALLGIAASRGPEAAPVPSFLGERQLPERVALLVKEVSMSKTRRRLVSLASLACLALAACLAVRAFPLKAPAPVAGQDRAQASAHQQWLDEVGFIITDEEKAELARLKTDADFQKFVAGFWERRNPQPGSATNAFKQEYYRRLAYARENFHLGAPGIKDDRARIYVQFGSPDEIDSHPDGPPAKAPAKPEEREPPNAPYDLWKYRMIEGLGKGVILEFVDASRNGEYRLTTGSDTRMKKILKSSATPSGDVEDESGGQNEIIAGEVDGAPTGFGPDGAGAPRGAGPVGGVIQGGVVGGVPGGVVGGVEGGVVGRVSAGAGVVRGVPGGVGGVIRGRVAAGPDGPNGPDSGNGLKIVHRADPVYPPLAKLARVEGVVSLKVTVEHDGQVSNVEVASGDPLLAPAAIDAVRQWRYSPPAMAPAVTTVTVSFVLDR